MILSLDVCRARKGDCLILHYGSKRAPGLALIDGGPAQVCKPYLKPRLAQIRQARGLAADDVLKVDLLLLSHIDDDHITGILELTHELVDAQVARQPLPVKIAGLWHNTFDDIIGNDPAQLLAAVTASFGAAALRGEPDTTGLDSAAAMLLASVDQGVRLRDDARVLKLAVNSRFSGGLVLAAGKGHSIAMGKGLKLTVIGPMKRELAALQKEHDAWLKAQKSKPKPVPASFTDTSVPNLASIVVLAEVAKKSILLTGDARGDKVLEGMELVRRLAPGGTLHVDVLKMPHHGSDRNLDPVFFQRLTADHYVFSGNGENGNPERATLQMLLDARGDATFTLHLTYPLADIDLERKKDWDKEQQRERAAARGNPRASVREDWSPEKHSLTAFFAAHPDAAAKLSIVEDGTPHVINLLDRIEF